MDFISVTEYFFSDKLINKRYQKFLFLELKWDNRLLFVVNGTSNTALFLFLIYLLNFFHDIEVSFSPVRYRRFFFFLRRLKRTLSSIELSEPFILTLWEDLNFSIQEDYEGLTDYILIKTKIGNIKVFNNVFRTTSYTIKLNGKNKALLLFSRASKVKEEGFLESRIRYFWRIKRDFKISKKKKILSPENLIRKNLGILRSNSDGGDNDRN